MLTTKTFTEFSAQMIQGLEIHHFFTFRCNNHATVFKNPSIIIKKLGQKLWHISSLI